MDVVPVHALQELRQVRTNMARELVVCVDDSARAGRVTKSLDELDGARDTLSRLAGLVKPVRA